MQYYSIERRIPEIARTIHQSFSSDPLIQWLRPNAVAWIKQDQRTLSWQYRRIQRIMLEGEVFGSLSVEQMAMQYPRQSRDGVSAEAKPDVSTSMHVENNSISGNDAGAVVFLFPPQGRKSWNIPRAWLACKLWVLDRLKPVDDNASEKRVEMLLDKHEHSVQSLRKRYLWSKLWYLEVVAVHPSLQSRGLGGGVMRWILEHVQNEPIYLECTRKENIGFYQSFGFEVAEEVAMMEDQEDSRHWVMVRPGGL
ncbi:unnamed protein product [Penicillium salamii]|uniref:N-acetyltransferase domain-containing protein n=1 Tax=Penicillium salamii TaxID=1612424 RepID=A0A9W4IJ59_9EURO|nr:unnamed protein product [Penicillium salamii]CAG8293148.1 unnamed protein product [Penicillium salamii]CAG8421300.1 unnamed protein product [Penicillium salamii]CAG8421814.1 unnamed protein product [Penicillium salamii]